MLRRLITAIVSLGMIAALVWSLSGLENKAQGLDTPAAIEPRYTAKNAEWIHLNKAGTAEFRLTAETVEYYDDRSAALSNVVMDRFRAGQSPWRLTAPQGTIPARENRVLLQSPVTATGTLQSGETVTFNTTHLWADSARNELYTEAPVEMSSLNWSATGTGLRADLAGEKLALLNNSKVIYVAHP